MAEVAKQDPVYAANFSKVAAAAKKLKEKKRGRKV
jgi:hypothetical protein